MKNLLTLLAVLVSAISLHAQVAQVVVSGSVRDAETGEALAGASVYTKDYRYGQITDNAGFFELKAVKDESLNLHVSYVGYKTQTIKVKADRKRAVTIKLEHDNQLRDVTIYAPSEIGIRSSQMSANELSIRQIKSIPATLGEVDILKALQTLPGVQSGSDGTAGIYVRGGNYDQNQITIDGFPVYNPEHLKGFVSVFSPEMVSGVTIYKGGFPARYGSRLSSVVDVELKDGDFDRYHGSLTAGVMSSALHVEGPIWKGHTSFSVSGRASYLNAIVIPVMKHIIDNQDVLNPYLKLNYYDVTARLAHRFSKRDRLTASRQGRCHPVKLAYADKQIFSRRRIDKVFQIGNGKQFIKQLGQHRWRTDVDTHFFRQIADARIGWLQPIPLQSFSIGKSRQGLVVEK